VLISTETVRSGSPLDTFVIPEIHDGAADQMVTDQTLQIVYAEFCRLAERIGQGAGGLRSIAELRAGPLGKDLARLAQVAAGQVREPEETVLAAVDSVVELLFWPAAADEFTVPRRFWETALGCLLARAKFRAFAPADFLGIPAAAAQLDVSRTTVYRWINSRMLDSVHDELTGRTFVLRRSIERCQQVAAAVEDDVLLGQRPHFSFAAPSAPPPARRVPPTT
jgi:hypothetical protein